MASDSELERVKARAELTEKILGDLQIRVAALKQAAGMYVVLKSFDLELLTSGFIHISRVLVTLRF